MLKKLTQTFPLWKQFVVEIPLIFVVLELFEKFLNSKELSLSHLSPHPYLFIVIGLGLVYGLPGGAFSGLISAVLVTEFKADAALPSYVLVYELFTPFALIISGITVGAFSGIQQSNLHEIREKANNLADSLADLDKDRERLTKSNLVLEKKVVTREDTILTLYEAAQNLSSLDIQAIFTAIPHLLTSYLKAQQCSVYVLNDKHLELMVNHNWKSKDQYPTVYDQQHPLFIKLKESHTILSKHDLQGIDEAMLIAPLITPQKKLYGMLKIEKISFLNLTPSSIKLFEMLSIWIMNAVVNAGSYDKSKQSQVKDELTGAYSFFFLKERLQREVRLAKRFKLNVALILVKIDDYEKMDAAIQENVLSIISTVMQFNFREDDIVARVEEEDFQFAVLQPFTTREEADSSLVRCVQEVLDYEFKPFKDEDIPLLLYWEILHIKEDSFFDHPLIKEVVGNIKEN